MERSRSTKLLILMGAVLGVILRPNLPVLLFSILGGVGFGFGIMYYTSVYSGTVWGIKIPKPTFGNLCFMLGAFGLVIGGFGIAISVLSALISLLSLNFLNVVLAIVPLIVTIVISPFIAKTLLENALLKSNSAQVLGQIDLFKQVHDNLDKATNFVVGFEGVALFSSTNYCYAVYRYEDYQLGSLSTTKEVALVGTYFIQRYGKSYTCKVDEEIIPGTPGQTVVAIGSGGVAVGRTQGTSDRRLFRSYIFTKK